MGRVPGTEHSGNIHLCEVTTHPSRQTRRIDESLCLASVRFAQDVILDRIEGENRLTDEPARPLPGKPASALRHGGFLRQSV